MENVEDNTTTLVKSMNNYLLTESEVLYGEISNRDHDVLTK